MAKEVQDSVISLVSTGSVLQESEWVLTKSDVSNSTWRKVVTGR